MLLFNEEGDVIFDFGNKFKADVFKDQNNNFKIMTSLSTNISYPEVHYDIYSLDGTLSVIQEEFLSKQKIISFPNPSSNTINITNPLKNNEKEKIEVYDMNGRKVLEKEIIGDGVNIELNISKLGAGIYNYRIRLFFRCTQFLLPTHLVLLCFQKNQYLFLFQYLLINHQ